MLAKGGGRGLKGAADTLTKGETKELDGRQAPGQRCVAGHSAKRAQEAHTVGNVSVLMEFAILL